MSAKAAALVAFIGEAVWLTWPGFPVVNIWQRFSQQSIVNI
jgi:hypothetical protein